MKAKTIGFDRRLNPQARYSTPGLPKTTQLISKDTFERQIKALAKSVSYPAGLALDISYKHPHDFIGEDHASIMFHKQIWDSLEEQRSEQLETLLAEIAEKAKQPEEDEKTLAELADLYIESASSEFSPARLIKLRGTIKRFLDYFGAYKKLEELVSRNVLNMTAYRNSFLAVKTRSFNYLVLEMSILKAFTRHASVKEHFSGISIEWGNCSRKKSGKQPFTDAELELILKEASDGGNKNMIRYHNLALYTGFRVSEVLQLKLSEIRLKDGKLIISKQKNGTLNQPFPIVPQLAEFLKKDLAGRNSREVYFLDNGFGTASFCDSVSLGNSIGRFFTKIGIEKKSSHTYRHTFANRLLYKTKNIHQVSKALRHGDTKTTEEYLSNEVADLHLNDTLSDIEF